MGEALTQLAKQVVKRVFCVCVYSAIQMCLTSDKKTSEQALEFGEEEL